MSGLPTKARRYRPRRYRRSANTRGRGFNRPLIVRIGDGTYRLISSGEAAERLGVSKRTLRGYEKDGVIPVHCHVDSLDRRWYLVEFVDFLKPLLKDQSRRKIPHWRLAERVEQAWNEIKNTLPTARDLANVDAN